MLGSILRSIGFGLCHQSPARSFFSGGVQVPVCARDTGIYMGFVLSLVLLAILARGSRPSGAPRRLVLAVVVVFVGIMAWDGVSSYAGWRSTGNDLRLLTGLFAGSGLAVVVFPMVNGQLWRRPGREGPLATGRELGLWLTVVPGGFALVRWGLPFLGAAYPVLVAVSVLATFVAVNLVLVCLVPRFEGRADRLGDAMVPMTLATVAALAEITASGLLRMWLERLAGLR